MSKPVVFISYSHKDEIEKEQLIRHLDVLKLQIETWSDDNIHGGGKWREEISRAIEKADIAVLLISANFLTSDFILEQEIPQILKRQDNGELIVFPIVARECAWQNVEWLVNFNVRPKNGTPVWRDEGKYVDKDLTNITKEIAVLLENKQKSTWPTFQNRKGELDELLNNLTNFGGERFFLLLSGPQMGKTWLLDELSSKLEDKSNAWKILRMDLRGQTIDLCSDGLKLLSAYFGLKPAAEEDSITQIARKIVRSKRPWLLLLDSAEFLHRDAAAELRRNLSGISKLIHTAGNTAARLAFVAASRSELKSWNSILPKPRFNEINLTYFNKEVIIEALGEMTKIDNHNKLKRKLNIAEALNNATEGLPALLMKYMQWIRDEAYLMGVEDICSQERFIELAIPYIKHELLSADILLPFSTKLEPVNDRLKVLQKILLKLSAYRWLSESHLGMLLETENNLDELLKKSKWDVRDLWNALSHSYLIRPSRTIWHRMSPAVRRLLFRYQYPEPEQQRMAHEKASQFLGEWWQEISGTDRSLYLIESLWHFVESKRLSEEEVGQKDILDYTRVMFSEALEPNHNTIGDLATYITARLNDDEELQYSLNNIHPELFEQILKIIEDIDTAQEEKS